MTDQNTFTSPVFTPGEHEPVDPFCLLLMSRVRDKNFRFRLRVRGLFAKLHGRRKRNLKKSTLDDYVTLLLGMCFYYNPKTNRVQRTVTQLALECGLASVSPQGTISITRVWRAIQSLDVGLELIAYGDCGDCKPGILFRPAIFEVLNVTPEELSSARNCIPSSECIRHQAPLSKGTAS